MTTKLFIMAGALSLVTACHSNDNRVTETSTGTTSATTTDSSAVTTTDAAATAPVAAPVTAEPIAPAQQAAVNEPASPAETLPAPDAIDTKPTVVKKTRTTHHVSRRAAVMTSKHSTLMSGQDYAVIDFKNGSTQLTDASKTKLQNLISGARSRGDVDDIYVAAWSDKSFPSAKKAKNLAKADRQLATGRLDSVDRYLKDDLSTPYPKKFNMAEHSNWFARAFHTKDAALKSLFAKNGAPRGIDVNEFHVIRDVGGPGRAIVLLDKKAPSTLTQARADNPRGAMVMGPRDVAVAPVPVAVPVTVEKTTTTSTVSGTTTSASARPMEAKAKKINDRTALRSQAAIDGGIDRHLESVNPDYGSESFMSSPVGTNPIDTKAPFGPVRDLSDDLRHGD